MRVSESLKELGFSQYEIACYLALVAHHPANGSQLSRLAGVARSRVYDVLRTLVRRGLVDEAGHGNYIPLPPEELIRRLRTQFESNLKSFQAEVNRSTLRSGHDHVWTLRGYAEVLSKARDMIGAAEVEIYIRLWPEETAVLTPDLRQAVRRGIKVKFIALGEAAAGFDFQVLHPESDKLPAIIGGRSLDLVYDMAEALSGVFIGGQEELSPINWSRNRCFVASVRDGLRHDFYHYFLHVLHETGRPLTKNERRMYELIKGDHWEPTAGEASS